MPEETAPVQSTVDLNPTSKKIEFSRGKIWLLVSGFLILLFIGSIGGYFAGQQSNKNEPIISQKDTTKETDKENPDEDVKIVGIDEEVEVKNGITIKLEEAKIDTAYEQQKKDQKAFYQKNSSQSAYLDSEYFTSSNLILKIVLTNKGKLETSYNPQGFRLKDSKDNQYVTGLDEGEKTTIYGLNPSETTKLSLSYIIPENEKRFELIYENAIIEFSL